MGDKLCLKYRERIDYMDSLIHNGTKKSDALHKAAQKFGLSYSGMVSFYRKKSPNKSSHHENSLLSKQQDDILIGFLRAFSNLNASLSTSDINEMVTSIWNIIPGKNWASRWIKTKKEHLTLRKSKALAKKRIDNQILEYIDNFIALIEESKDKFVFSSKNVLNYDETKIAVRSGGDIRVFSNHANLSNFKAIGYKVIGSYIPIVIADGKVFMSVFIFPCKTNDESDLGEVKISLPSNGRETRSKWKRYFMFTESGCMNRRAFRLIMNEFIKQWDISYPNMHCYIFGDQLTSHIDPLVLASGFEKNIFFWFLPANTSHFMQPLDNICFANLKKLEEYFSKGSNY